MLHDEKSGCFFPHLQGMFRNYKVLPCMDKKHGKLFFFCGYLVGVSFCIALAVNLINAIAAPALQRSRLFVFAWFWLSRRQFYEGWNSFSIYKVCMALHSWPSVCVLHSMLSGVHENNLLCVVMTSCCFAHESCFKGFMQGRWVSQMI